MRIWIQVVEIWSVSYEMALGQQLLTFRAYRSRDAPPVYTFNNCTLCIYVFCIYLRANSDFCPIQHKLIGFYNRYEKCLQRGTDWCFNLLAPEFFKFFLAHPVCKM
jgi:hypothetical protein